MRRFGLTNDMHCNDCGELFTNITVKPGRYKRIEDAAVAG